MTTMATGSSFQSKRIFIGIILLVSGILYCVLYIFSANIPTGFLFQYNVSQGNNNTSFLTCSNTTSTRKQTVSTGIQPITPKWQPVGDGKDLFVFSAYFNKEKQAVQVIGIALVQIKVNCTCTFTTATATATATAAYGDGESVRGHLEIIPEHHGRRYSASIVTCSVGNVSNPRTVTLRIQKRNTTLTVFYPSREKVQFTICFPAVHSNYKNREELVQAISMNRILGAERFVLYNHSMSSTLHGVINVFVQNQALEVVQWKLPVSEIHYVAQLAAVHDCFYKNRYTSKYIIFQDLDEFIIPKQFLGWDRMMSKLKRDYPLAGTFIFRHTFFPRYWPDAFLNTSDDKDIQDHKLYLLTKISRHARIMGWNERSKFIVVPSRVRIIGIHHVPGHEPGFRDVLVNQSIGLLHHYRASAPDSAHRVNDTSVRRFTSQLVAMTGSVWNCTGMT